MIDFPRPEKTNIIHQARRLNRDLQSLKTKAIASPQKTSLFQGFLTYKALLDIAAEFLHTLIAKVDPDVLTAANLAYAFIMRSDVSCITLRDKKEIPQIVNFINNVHQFSTNFVGRVEILITISQEQKLTSDDSHQPPNFKIRDIFLTAEDAFVSDDRLPSNLETKSDKKFYGLYLPMKIFLLSREKEELEKDRSSIAIIGKDLIDQVNLSVVLAEDYLKDFELQAKDARQHASAVSTRIVAASNIVGGLSFPPYCLFSSAKILAEIIAERIDRSQKPSPALHEALMGDMDCYRPLDPPAFKKQGRKRPDPV